jgi:hypothetical protein
MNKKSKIILIIWFIFISIIFLIMLLLLGLRLPQSFKIQNDKIENNVQMQSQYQPQYIYDKNKINNIIRLMNALQRLKTLNQFKTQTEYIYDKNKINNIIVLMNALQRLKTQIEYYDDQQFQYQPKLNDNFIPSNNHNINENDADKLIALGLIGIALPPLGIAVTATSIIAFLPLLI